MIDRFATKVSDAMGSTPVIVLAFLLVIIWAPTFLVIGDVDTWQLIINTTTTIITFLMVFIIQRTQNRDTNEIVASLRAITEKLGIEDERDAKMEEKCTSE
jgi:low affinity Fe/Cu permease